MSKENNNRDQYIITYDIENSKIYEVWYYYEYRNLYVKCPIYQKYLTEYMGIETSYITNEYRERAEKIVNWSNQIHNMHYKLIGFTHKYLSNFYMMNVKTREVNSKFAYEPFTDDIIFDQIITLWLADSDILFTAHNLDYEYNYIRYNTKLLQKLCSKCKEYNIIAETTANIKSIEFVSESGSKFIIRDTYLISNKSIKNLGKQYNIPKLEYDYEQTRLYRYDINDTDRKYNERDNVIAMTYLQEIINILPQYKDITKIPLSATQHSKNICKYNKSVNYKPEGKKCDLFTLHSFLSKKYNVPDFNLYRNFFNASGGGLIGVNPRYTGAWMKNVHSFDIKSAHPGQFYNKVFPIGDSIREVTNYDWIMKKYKQLSETMQKEPKMFYNKFLPEYDYLLLVEFHDLSAKVLPHGNIILSLGSGKQTQQYSENELTERTAFNYQATTKNGKTITSKVYRKWVFGIDLIYHLSFYNYDPEKTRIIKAYKYQMYACDQYIISKAEYYGEYKEKYKDFKFYAKSHDFEETAKYITENGAEEYTIKGLESGNYREFLSEELLRIKGIFNGLFGQEYQNIYHEDLKFESGFEIGKKTLKEQEETPTDKSEMELINEKYQDIIKKCNTHYTVGAYTAGWSRFELACMIWHCINNHGTIYYFHTDSLKCGGCKNDIFKNWYDPELNNSKWSKLNKFHFGAVDYEETFNYFYTPETLKNIGIMHDEKFPDKIFIDITISGIKANVYFADIFIKYCGGYYDHGELKLSGEKALEFNDENIKNLLHDLDLKMIPQIIPGELTGKLVRQKQYCGVKSELGQVNFGTLESLEYNFLHFEEE